MSEHRLAAVMVAVLLAWTALPLRADDTVTAIEFDAVVRHVGVEGGFHGLVAVDGRHFEPLQLPVDFAVDGLAVHVRGRLRTNVMSMRMWGQPLEILDIVKRP